LTVKPRPNRRKAAPRGSFWSRLPRPIAIADACGRALRRSIPALICLIVLAAVGGTAWAGYRFVTSSPRFAITEIQVNGVQHLTDEQVRAALTVRPGDNVFATSLPDVVRELRDNPWIASAEARRVLPHTIVIDVREHVPAAIVQLGALYLADADGHPFKRTEVDDGAGLPIITGLDRDAYVASPQAIATQIRSALAALQAWRSVEERPSIGEVHLDAHGALTLVTYEQAIAIQLGDLPKMEATEFTPGAGEDGLAGRMKTFDATWAELSPSEHARTRAIHLDARADQVTVAFAASDKP
jgi:cell division protein FtsQ